MAPKLKLIPFCNPVTFIVNVTLLPFFFLFVECSLIPFNNPNVTAPLAIPILPPETVCNATLYPIFCKSMLPKNDTCNIRDYSRISIGWSLSKAKKFMRLIDDHLIHRPTLPMGAIRALEDCKLLAGLNLDFLLNTFRALNSTKPLQTFQADDLQTLLSALLTNQQTCYDGLAALASAWSVSNGLYSTLSNETKLYSVSLALFTNGWMNKRKKKCKCSKGRKLAFSDSNVVRHGGVSFRMSSRNREVFESLSRRKLPKGKGDGVLVSDIVIVNPDGSGNFSTINDAVAAAPYNADISDGYFLIYVVSGVYKEYISIAKNKTNLMMMGDGINKTVITGNRNIVDGWTTYNSATFAVLGKGFVGMGITIRNTAGPTKYQAVAVLNGADSSTFYACSFEGYQDTLYAHSLRQFYRECDIHGTIDFIFGNAAAVFQNCKMYVRLPLRGQFNVITAQGRTDPNQNTGTSIQNCSIIAAPELAASSRTTKTYLGRPWWEYSRTVVMQSFIGKLVDPSGWAMWMGNWGLNTLYYGEFKNMGPGSNTSSRVPWPGYHQINMADAVTFTTSNFILGDDWLPATGVWYHGGLV